MTSLRITFTMLLTFSALGCGTDPLSLCEEAQDRGCTIINNCDLAIQGAEGVSEKSDCASQFDGYVDCVDAGDVCTGDDRCSSEQRSFGNCAAPYCLANPNDQDCVDLRTGF